MMKKINPFDVAHSFFSKKWDSLSSYDKKNAYFILNRMLAKENPIWAQSFNQNKIDPVGVMEFWRLYMSQQYTGTPQHMYISGKSQKENNKWDKIKKNTISIYCSRKELGTEDFESLKLLNPENLYEDLRDLQKHLENCE